MGPLKPKNGGRTRFCAWPIGVARISSSDDGGHFERKASAGDVDMGQSEEETPEKLFRQASNRMLEALVQQYIAIYLNTIVSNKAKILANLAEVKTLATLVEDKRVEEKTHKLTIDGLQNLLHLVTKIMQPTLLE
jgi:hypothetical protein